jgi:threonylcarbamoyladenosine tRNA methylthiotransferase MtaB
MKKAYLSTLGCKVNQFETAAFKTELEQRGLRVTADIADADLIIINTCTVTEKAGQESRREIARAARRNPGAEIVVTGCHAQLAADELRAMSDIDQGRLRIVKNDAKDQLVGSVLESNSAARTVPLPASQANNSINRLAVSRFIGRTRAYLRVQDGCESFCSYCIVPYTRGKSRSLPIGEVLEQAARYEAAGHREIVVTGIHVGHYGLDLSEGHDIVSLMARLCSRFRKTRFRLSSIEPLEINDQLLGLMAGTENFMPHLHIPLQSGDNSVLSRMNRRYRTEEFSKIISRCRTMLPDAALGLDVLVGFPGESEAQFNNTKALLESIDLSYLHVFPYSPRPGTRAAAFEGQVAKSVKQKRVEQLLYLSDEKKKAFYSRFIGSRRTALVEREKTSGGGLRGFTDNYIPLQINYDGPKPAGAVIVELDRLAEGVVQAHIAEQT